MFEQPNNLEELNTTLIAIGALTSKQMASRVKQGGYMVSSKIHYDSIELPQLPRGWTLTETRKPLKNLPRLIFICPTTNVSRKVYAEGQRHIAYTSGLPVENADRWLSSRSTHKFHLLSELVNLSYNSRLRDAYLTYNKDFTHAEFQTWSKDANIRDGLSPTKRAHLVDLIKEIII